MRAISNKSEYVEERLYTSRGVGWLGRHPVTLLKVSSVSRGLLALWVVGCLPVSTLEQSHF